MELMDIVDLIEHQLDEIESTQRIPRVRIINTRVDYYRELDENEFFARFRLSKNAVNYVHNLIEHKISSKTQRNHAVLSNTCILLTLRYLATGSFLRSAADFCGVSPPTASRIVKKVTAAIAELCPMMIKFPDNLSSLQEGFYKIARFPRVIAAIDCTHVTIKSPGDNLAENYKNWKKSQKTTFSINVQVACDSQLRCLNIVARWPGSVHNQTIFNNSSLKQRIESGQFGNGVLLGDSSYELKQYLLTPFSNPSSSAENLYNQSHIRTRTTIERCFGMCKNRFPVLKGEIKLKLSRVQPIIVACFVLHNIAIESNERHFGDNHEHSMDEDLNDDTMTPTSQWDIDPRDSLVQEYFLPLLNRNDNSN